MKENNDNEEIVRRLINLVRSNNITFKEAYTVPYLLKVEDTLGKETMDTLVQSVLRTVGEQDLESAIISGTVDNEFKHVDNLPYKVKIPVLSRTEAESILHMLKGA